MSHSVDIRVHIRDKEFNLFQALERAGVSIQSDTIVSLRDMEVTKSFVSDGNEVEEIIVKLGSLSYSSHPQRVYDMCVGEAWPWWKRLLNLFSTPRLEPLPEPTYEEAVVNEFKFFTDEGSIIINRFNGIARFEGFEEKGYKYSFDVTLTLDNLNKRGRRILLN